jgi:hypothetical protein
MFSYNLTSVSIARLSIIGDVYDVSAAPEFFGPTQDMIADMHWKNAQNTVLGCCRQSRDVAAGGAAGCVQAVMQVSAI